MISGIDSTKKEPRFVLETSNLFDTTAMKGSGEINASPRGQVETFRIVEGPSIDEAMLLHVQPGLQLLWDSCVCARQASAEPWEFSVEWPELRRLGLTCNDVRWLIRQGLVQHAYEVTEAEDNCRKFVPCTSLNLSRRTCLVMTEEGRQVSRPFIEERGVIHPARISRAGEAVVNVKPAHDCGIAGLILPRWDRDRRQLRLGSKIIKEFKVPAPNQEIILDVFEEENWPVKIDDPLPHKTGVVPQRRLHDTINSLNRRQRHRLLHFAADGLGLGVRWNFFKPSNPPLSEAEENA